ncbi:MAG: multiheme c-type cytochrome, partial [Myxococcota bacterium]
RELADLETLETRARAARSDGAELVIALTNLPRRAQRGVAIEGVDFVVQGGLDSERALPPTEASPAWLLHAGRQGQGVLVLDLFLDGRSGAFVDVSEWSLEVARSSLVASIQELEARLEGWRAEGRTEDELASQAGRLRAMQAELEALAPPELPAGARGFSAHLIALDRQQPRNGEVAERLGALDRRINDFNETTYADRRPPEPEEGQAHYVGSDACASCHSAAHAWWLGHAHGRAYATLQGLNKEFHLECVGCHVTGYERPGGSTVTQLLDGALRNVGCENCHGAGSAHIESPLEASLPAETPESVCVSCHNEQHSDLFNYEVYVRTLRVRGHGLPE